MALTGLQIHKLLPRTNCKECGSNTCLAFAMKLAQKKASIADCPHADDGACWMLRIGCWTVADDAADACRDRQTCPVYRRLEMERLEREAEPCGQS